MQTKRPCTKCGEIKPLDQFSKAPRGRFGVKASCKSCDALRHATLHPPQPRRPNPKRRPEIDPRSPKTCTHCGETKPHFDFSLSRAATATTNAVYRSRCKACQSEQARDWFARNPERSAESKRRLNLKQLYGLTVAEYNELLRKQSGVCGICGKGEPAVHGRNGKQFRLSVDHCHGTGAIRGLLCQRCNRALGLLGDDPRVLRKAITYLLRAGVTHQGGQ